MQAEITLPEAQKLRRELEVEMAGIDGKIKDAIMAGNADLMNQLQTRKAELPRLYLIQSHAERRVSDQIYGKDYNDAMLGLDSAKADFDAKTAAFEALQERHRRELEAAETALRNSENAKSVAQGEFIRANGALTNSQQGHKRALERLGDVMIGGKK